MAIKLGILLGFRKNMSISAGIFLGFLGFFESDNALHKIFLFFFSNFKLENSVKAKVKFSSNPPKFPLKK
jgi:hypothetical protein